MIFFKLPNSEILYSTDGNQAVKHISFIAFDGKESVDFHGNLIEIKPQELPEITSKKLSISEEKNTTEEREIYLKKISEVRDFVQNHHLKKLVISRKKTLDLTETQTLSLDKSFLNLCQNYPNALVYLFQKNGFCWLGAFSELLGKYDKKTQKFQTMSLAGTLPIDETWTQKEIEEQQPVTEYIREILLQFSGAEGIKQSETYDHFSGNIKHLRTDFEINLKPDFFASAISQLHPTPAVCGIPKAFCQESIAQFENHNRELYAGYSQIETEDHIFCFVNLRCAKIYKNKVNMFVGGGITAESHPEKEWRETELKAEAIQKNLLIF